MFLGSATFSAFGSLCNLAFHQLTLSSHLDTARTPHGSTIKEKWRQCYIPRVHSECHWRYTQGCDTDCLLAYLHPLIIWTPVWHLKRFGCTDSMSEVTDIYTVEKLIHHQNETSSFFGLVSTSQCQCLWNRLTQHLEWIGNRYVTYWPHKSSLLLIPVQPSQLSFLRKMSGECVHT